MKRLFTLCLLMLPLLTAMAQGPNNSGTYYQNADGKKGSALKTALCGIIYDRNEGGPLNTAYKALWTHFEKTDKKTMVQSGICILTNAILFLVRIRLVAIKKRVMCIIVSILFLTAGLVKRSCLCIPI